MIDAMALKILTSIGFLLSFSLCAAEFDPNLILELFSDSRVARNKAGKALRGSGAEAVADLEY